MKSSRDETIDLESGILTSSAGKEIYSWLPQVYGEAYIFLKILTAISEQLDKVKIYAEDLKNQVRPQYAEWSLSFWEERYNIKSNSELPTEARRRAIVNKIRTRYPISPERLEDEIFGLTGAKVRVVEQPGKNLFQVDMRDANAIQAEKAKEIIDRLKPAHLIYKIETGNWHSILGGFTHKQLGRYTHQELQIEEPNVGPIVACQEDFNQMNLDVKNYTNINLPIKVDYTYMDLLWNFGWKRTGQLGLSTAALVLKKLNEVCLELKIKCTYSGEQTLTISSEERVLETIEIGPMTASQDILIQSYDNLMKIVVKTLSKESESTFALSEPILNREFTSCEIRSDGSKPNRDDPGDGMKLGKLKIIKL